MRYGIYSAIGVFLMVVALMLMPDSATERLNAVMRDAFAPFMSGLQGRRYLQVLVDARAREDEIMRLRRELAHSAAESRTIQKLERENRELRGMLQLARRSPYSLQASTVISRNINSWWQSARLGLGSGVGASVGMPVITADGLVGRLISVSSRTADVLFLIDPGSRVAGMIPRVNAYGIIQGQGVDLRGPALCRMDFISREAGVSSGDEVVTSGLGGVFPAGLLIGYVRKVDMDDTGLYKSAEILPAADFRNLQMVFLVKDE